MKSKPSRILFLVLLLCLSGKTFSQVLSAGDIAFTGINATDNVVNGSTLNDDLSFVLLKSIPAGTEIYFTDFGWRNDMQAFQRALPCGGNSGSVTDGVVKWKSDVDMNYGTQVIIRCKFSPTANLGTATGFQPTYNSTTQYVNISTAGESIFAFQGTLANPSLIAGINVNAAGWTANLSDCDYDPTKSTQPNILKTNNTSFTLNFTGNVRLKSSVVFTGNPLTDRTAIASASNWEMNAGTAFALPAQNASLPISLSSFTGIAAAEGNLLRWQVGVETGASGYTIERSEDGIKFLPIGFMNAQNRSNASYLYTDQYKKRKAYYRLKATDLDGSYFLSSTIVVQQKISEPFFKVMTGLQKLTISLEGENDALFTAKLSHPDGRVINTVRSSGGVAEFAWGSLPGGVYIVSFEGESRKAIKVVKK